MNIGNAARDEMLAFAARGRLGIGAVQPQAQLEVPRAAERGGYVDIRWNVTFAERVVLRIVRPGEVPTEEIVRLVGKRRLQLEAVGAHRVIIEARAHPPRPGHRRRAQSVRVVADLDVAPPKPVIKYSAPFRALLGEPIPVTWTIADAEEALVIIDGSPRPIDLVGALNVQTDACGERAVTIFARGPGGSAEQRLIIKVNAPPVTITAPKEVSADLGDTAVIRYVVSGARAISVDRMDPWEPAQAVPASGRIEVLATVEPERVRIVAEGHNGKRVVRTVTVTARLFSFPSIAEHLAALDRRVR